MAWLRGQWLATHEQGGRIAVVSGPSGIGKTRLLARFADEVQRSGCVVVRRTGLTAPNLATVAAVAAGGAALVVLDDPLTGLDPTPLSGLPVLVVAGIDRDAAPATCMASLAAAAWRELDPLPDDVCARIAQRWLGTARTVWMSRRSWPPRGATRPGCTGCWPTRSSSGRGSGSTPRSASCAPPAPR